MTSHAAFVIIIGMIIAVGFCFLLFMFTSVKNFFIGLFVIFMTGYLLTGWSCNWERPCPTKSSSIYYPTTVA